MRTTGEGATPSALVCPTLAAPQRRLPPLVGRGLSGFAEDLLVVDSQVTELERQMADLAQVEGFAMGHIYVEKPESWPAAFEALIESVNRYEVTAIVLPSLLHLAALAATHDVQDTFERATGARVLVLAP